MADRGEVRIFAVSYCNNRSVPLALGMIQAYAQGPRLSHLHKEFRFLQLLNMPDAQLLSIAKAFGPGIWLFSNYLWTIERTLQASRAVKALDPRNIVIHGGPSTPKYEEDTRRHLARYPQIDIAVHGEGEFTAADLIEHFVGGWGERHRHDGLERIPGITYRREDARDQFTRTAERARIEDLNELPSPYLTGVFDHCYGERGIKWAALETNRGCPYQCTFCDWGALTQQKIKLFDMDRLKAEIEWIARREIPIAYLTDANVGILERDLEIAERFAWARRTFGYPTHLTCSLTKNGSSRVPQIARIWKDAGIDYVAVMSLQTTDQDTLAILKRGNIRTESFEKQMADLREVGVGITSELMIGIPGQTVDTFKRDLQFLADHDVVVTGFKTRLLPNSPMASPEYRRKYAIEVDGNEYVASTFSFTREDLEEMQALFDTFGGCINLSCFRYVLFHIQWEHGVGMVDFLHELLKDIRRSPEFYSETTHMVWGDNRLFIGRLFEGSGEFYEDLTRFAERRFGVVRDSAFETVLLVNRSILPLHGATYPLDMILPHDVTAYFVDRMAKGAHAHRKLADYPPGRLSITDPEGWAHRSPDDMFPEITLRLMNWELYSSLRDAMGSRAAPRTDGKITA